MALHPPPGRLAWRELHRRSTCCCLRVTKCKQLYSALNILSSWFRSCSSQGAGGAISAYSNAVSTNNFVQLQITSSIFLNCTSSTDGGAVSVLGSAVVAMAHDSSFDLCHASNSGGAFAGDDQAALVIKRVLCNGNSGLLPGPDSARDKWGWKVFMGVGPQQSRFIAPEHLHSNLIIP